VEEWRAGACLAKDLGEDVVDLLVGAVVKGLLPERRIAVQELACRQAKHGAREQALTKT
jgi:hypothetical protein